MEEVHSCLSDSHSSSKKMGGVKENLERMQFLHFPVIRNSSHQFLQAFLKLMTVISTVCL